MAETFKPFGANDTTTTRTLLHEAIPVTGTIISGTYTKAKSLALNAELNIKNFSHGMFQSVYDYPYLSSSANHLLDITVGYHSTSKFSGASATVQQEKKINVYNQMAQLLMGYDVTGGIKPFKIPNTTAVDYMREAIFINFSRLLTKDEIKKGSFTLKFGRDPNGEDIEKAPNAQQEIVQRYKGEDVFYTDSPAGEYAVLSGTTAPHCGLIFYQAGVVVLTASFLTSNSGAVHQSGCLSSSLAETGKGHLNEVFTGSAISASCGEIRNRLANIEFNNTTELNSAIYFCRANHNEFNYSSNPTYLSGSKIRVKATKLDEPVSYITTIGLYSADYELLATAKLSEPLKKTPRNELTVRVRLDY